MKPIDARDENFMLISIDDKYVALFTNMRLDRDTIPEDLHTYDVRDGGGDGEFAQIQKFVMVNHWGTIICKDPLPMNEWHCYYPEQDAYYFPYASSLTMEEFRSTPIDELIKKYNEPPNLDSLVKGAQTRSSASSNLAEPSKEDPTR